MPRAIRAGRSSRRTRVCGPFALGSSRNSTWVYENSLACVGPLLQLLKRARASITDGVFAIHTPRARISLFIDDWISQQSDLVNLNFAQVACLHPQRRLARMTDASGRAHDQQIAGF